MTIPFQVSGKFASDNVFILQASQDSFATFSNVAIDSTGMLAFSYSPTLSCSMRVISTDPFEVSNGADVELIALPKNTPYATRFVRTPFDQFGWISLGPALDGHPKNNPPIFPLAFVGDSISFLSFDSGTAAPPYRWIFDQDARPSTSSEPGITIAYQSEGIKTGSLTTTNVAGCVSTVDFAFRIVGCDPVIPSNAHVVTHSESGSDSVALVKPGGVYTYFGTDASNATIFVEPGGSLILEGSFGGVCYVKMGGSVVGLENNHSYLGLVMEGTLTGPTDTLFCSQMNFDYSHITGAVAAIAAPEFQISHWRDHLVVSGSTLTIGARICNILGRELLAQRGLSALDFDLSQLLAGTYFAIIQAGDQREVRRIAVVH